MRFPIKTLIFSTIMLLMAGCAQLSPQQVVFAPSIPAKQLIQGQGTVSLAVIDKRSSTAIGLRGGTYAESAVISAQNSLQEVIESLATQVLAKSGMIVTSTLPDTQIEISLNQLTYSVTPLGASIKRSKALATMSIKVERDNTTYVKNHRTSQYIDTVGYASEKKNAALLNEVFDIVLENLLTDAGLEAFLSN